MLCLIGGTQMLLCLIHGSTMDVQITGCYTSSKIQVALHFIRPLFNYQTMINWSHLLSRGIIHMMGTLT